MSDPTQQSTPSATEGGDGQQPSKRQRSRFVISQLRAHHRTLDERQSARRAFDDRFQQVLKPHVNVLADRAPDEQERRVLVVEAALEDLVRAGKELPPDTMIEPELPRTPALAVPPVLKLWKTLHGPIPPPAAQGTALALEFTSDGAPLRDASVILLLARVPSGPQDQPPATQIAGRTDAGGKVSLPYDPTAWFPHLVVVEPAGGAWSVVLQQPRSGQRLEIPPLPRGGPLGWWHLLMGATRYSEQLGTGIRVGVIDTGVGPHPYLSHVRSVGAFLDGQWQRGEEAGLDARNHGTHVSGLIGARPPQDSGEYAGLAPGAELLMARVFTATGGGNQGDIAHALDVLAASQADLINMSLVGEYSAIEQDAILSALQQGALCICSAGNQNGAPVGFPASNPECVAVSALGLMGTWAPDSIASMNLPSAPDRYTPQGLFLASFSNVGPQVGCTAPGNGIISTVPATEALPAPYADMSGTSMSAPLTTGALAVLLSEDPVYRQLPRDWSRAAYARAALGRGARQLGLSPLYEGSGLARESTF
ncbi:MAG: S8 family serine peptidase [Myxococcaceae bacterium]|nr:S8 family serine peptidase [Myxococcaceae bacterium]